VLKNLLSIIFLALLALLLAGISLDWNFEKAPVKETNTRLCEHGKLTVECEKCNPKLARGGTYLIQEREAQPGECPNVLKRVVLASGVRRDNVLPLSGSSIVKNFGKGPHCRGNNVSPEPIRQGFTQTFGFSSGNPCYYRSGSVFRNYSS